MDAIRAAYDVRVRETGSDIHEHLPVLRRLAAGGCRSAAELGVRGVVATWALLLGLAEYHAEWTPTGAAPSGSAAPVLYGMDVNLPPPQPGAHVSALIDVAGRAGVRYEFIQGDSARTPLPAPVDLLFVDTWHVYGHLRRELALHERDVLRWIVLHDTAVDAKDGESVRLGWDVERQARESGYPAHEIARGLRPAVEEFLQARRGQWLLERHYPNNNGLTVLRRVAPPQAAGGGRPAGRCPSIVARPRALHLLLPLLLLALLAAAAQRWGHRPWHSAEPGARPPAR